MIKFFASYKTFLAVMAIISSVILVLFYNALKPDEKLPVFQPAKVNYELVDQSLRHIKKFHKIGPFSLTNQNGLKVTEQDYRNKIYVADFFFTTCQGICPKMTANMGLIQEAIKEDSQVKLVSFSVTPEIDSVAQLKKYALEKGVIDTKWNLLTGEKKHIYDLARKSFFAAKNDGDGGKNDMIHTENFILIDPDKRIRGFYDGTDSNLMKKLIADIKILQKEYSKT
tara:strand:- start:894 stop:1571 length:678 start_codon:yes stop_codon:yes gene_type:complete